MACAPLRCAPLGWPLARCIPERCPLGCEYSELSLEMVMCFMYLSRAVVARDGRRVVNRGAGSIDRCSTEGGGVARMILRGECVYDSSRLENTHRRIIALIRRQRRRALVSRSRAADHSSERLHCSCRRREPRTRHKNRPLSEGWQAAAERRGFFPAFLYEGLLACTLFDCM